MIHPDFSKPDPKQIKEIIEIRELLSNKNILEKILSYQNQIIGFHEKNIKIPIYNKKWKIRVINWLKQNYYLHSFSYDQEKLISKINFSKFIPPDDWHRYSLKKNNTIPYLFSPVYDFWEVEFMHEFWDNDLSYGIKPESILKVYYEALKNKEFISVIVDLNDQNIYIVDKIIKNNFINAGYMGYTGDFKKFKSDENFVIDWHKMKIQ